MNPGVQFVIDKCENQLAVSEGADEVSDKIVAFKNSFFWFWLSVVLLCNCLEIAVCCDGHPSVFARVAADGAWRVWQCCSGAEV